MFWFKGKSRFSRFPPKKSFITSTTDWAVFECSSQQHSCKSSPNIWWLLGLSLFRQKLLWLLFCQIFSTSCHTGKSVQLSTYLASYLIKLWSLGRKVTGSNHARHTSQAKMKKTYAYSDPIASRSVDHCTKNLCDPKLANKCFKIKFCKSTKHSLTTFLGTRLPFVAKIYWLNFEHFI